MELAEFGFALNLAVNEGVPAANLEIGEQFDVIFAIEVLEHIIEFEEVMKTLSKVIKPGGTLILTTGNLGKHKGKISEWSYAKSNPDVHITFFTQKAMRELVKHYGFTKKAAKLNSYILRYKIVKNIALFENHKKTPHISKIFLKFHILLAPLVPLADRAKGISDLAIWEKGTP